jgi:hypothetical protein
MKDGKVSSSRRLVILDVELLAMVVEYKEKSSRRRFISGVLDYTCRDAIGMYNLHSP